MKHASCNMFHRCAPHLKTGTDYGTYSAAQPDTAAKNMMFASVDSQQTCYEYVPKQSCIATERIKNCQFSGRTLRHSLPQNASSAQPRQQFVPQAFFCKLSNVMFVASMAAMLQNTFDSLYRPLEINYERGWNRLMTFKLKSQKSGRIKKLKAKSWRRKLVKK